MAITQQLFVGWVLDTFRCPARVTILLAVILATCIPNSALATTRPLTPGEITKVGRLLMQMEESFRKTGLLGRSLEDVFSELPDGSDQDGDQIEYEEGASSTIQDMIDTLRDMLDEGRIVASDEVGTGAATTTEPGLDADEIEISQEVLEQMCDETLPAARRAFLKFCLGASLANEIVHVFQVFGDATEDSQECDAERDSDVLSMLYLCSVVEQLRDDDGNPILDIRETAGECPWMFSCLANFGVMGGDIPDIIRDIEEVKEDEFEDRIENLFGRHIENGTSWADEYYGGHRDADWIPHILDGGNSVGLDFQDGEPLKVYPTTPGASSVRAIITRDLEGRAALQVVEVVDGGLSIVTRIDEDGDGCPDLEPTSRVSGPPLELPPREGDLQLLGWIPGAGGARIPGLFLIDNLHGTMSLAPVDESFVPRGAFRFLLQDERITLDGGGFRHVHRTVPGGDGEGARILLTSSAAGMASALTLAVAIETTGGEEGEFFPGEGPAPLGDLLAPYNPVGAFPVQAGVTELTLVTVPSELATLSAVGRGSREPLIEIEVNSPGGVETVEVPELQDGQLYLLESAGRQLFYFLPPLGKNIDCALVDTDGDALIERMQVSRNPTRLHLLEGIRKDEPIFVHVYEQVLEDPESIGGLDSWDDPEQRRLRHSRRGLIPVTTSPEGLEGEPLYLQSLVDLDDDGELDDGVTVVRSGSGAVNGDPFHVVSILDVLDGAIEANRFPLSGDFIPEGLTFLQDGSEGPVKIQIDEFGGDSPVCLENSGGGNFGSIDCLEPQIEFRRGDVNGDGSLDISDPISNLSFQFIGNFEPGCEDALDTDGSDTIDVSDPVFNLTYLFTGGAAPPAPGPLSCGPDPTDDGLTCDSYTSCEA